MLWAVLRSKSSSGWKDCGKLLDLRWFDGYTMIHHMLLLLEMMGLLRFFWIFLDERVKTIYVHIYVYIYIYSAKTTNIANHKVFKAAFPVPGGSSHLFSEDTRKPAKWPVSSPPKVNRLRSPESTVANKDITCQWSSIISMKIQVITMLITILIMMNHHTSRSPHITYELPLSWTQPYAIETASNSKVSTK